MRIPVVEVTDDGPGVVVDHEGDQDVTIGEKLVVITWLLRSSAVHTGVCAVQLEDAEGG